MYIRDIKPFIKSHQNIVVVVVIALIMIIGMLLIGTRVEEDVVTVKDKSGKDTFNNKVTSVINTNTVKSADKVQTKKVEIVNYDKIIMKSKIDRSYVVLGNGVKVDFKNDSYQLICSKVTTIPYLTNFWLAEKTSAYTSYVYPLTGESITLKSKGDKLSRLDIKVLAENNNKIVKKWVPKKTVDDFYNNISYEYRSKITMKGSKEGYAYSFNKSEFNLFEMIYGKVR